MSTQPSGRLEDVQELLRQLVRLDTTSARSNLALIDLVEERVGDFATEMFRVPDDTGQKANLVVRFGPDAGGGVVLSGHTDCVPVEADGWSSDPFILHADDDLVRGRGTADMKGFLACCIAAAPTLRSVSTPVWLAFSYDEEIGAVGARRLVPAMVEAGARPMAVIVGEPTSLEPVTAHKSVRTFTYEFTGRSGHSSQPALGSNAVVAAGRLVTYIAQLADKLVGEVDLDFDPPHTTFNVGVIEGGTAVNIIPDRCRVTFEFRALPQQDSPLLAEQIEAYAREQLLPDLQRTSPAAALTVTVPGELPAFRREQGGGAERLVRTLTGSRAPARTAPFGTDASWFQQAGWSTVVCGPGQIEVAHRRDEWVGLDQLDAARRMVLDLAARLS